MFFKTKYLLRAIKTKKMSAPLKTILILSFSEGVEFIILLKYKTRNLQKNFLENILHLTDKDYHVHNMDIVVYSRILKLYFSISVLFYIFRKI